MNNKNDFCSALAPVRIPQRYLRCTLTGKRGIRTPGTQKGSTVFETVRIDHSRIFPYAAISRTRLTRFERATPTSAGWCSNPAEL